MVHFPGFARTRLWIHRAVLRFYRSGFPHSDIPGSKPACGSPRLIAACHVLHRLLLPRHPPCALSSLTIKFTRRRDGFAASFFSYQLLAISKDHPAPRKVLVPKSCSSHARAGLERGVPQQDKALIKFTQPCRLPNLFSCQTSCGAGTPARVPA